MIRTHRTLIGDAKRTLELQRDAVTLCVSKHAELVDVADVPRRELQRNVSLELGNPHASRLDVHVLPALRLDVRVGDVLRQKLAFPSDFALRHDFLEKATRASLCALLTRGSRLQTPTRSKAPNVLTQGAGKVAEADAYVKHKKRSFLEISLSQDADPSAPEAAPIADRPENCASGTSGVVPWRALGNAAPKILPSPS